MQGKGLSHEIRGLSDDDWRQLKSDESPAHSELGAQGGRRDRCVVPDPVVVADKGVKGVGDVAPVVGRPAKEQRVEGAPAHSGPTVVGPLPREKTVRQRGAVKYLTQEQVNALFDAIPKSGNVTAIRDLAIFRIGYHHGLRAGEMGLLQLSDVNEARGRIHIRRLKRSNSGDYALLTAETKALRAWLKLRGRKPGPLFPSRKRKGISQQMLDVLMKGYGQLAELPRELRHFHSLKHSCATHLLEQGRDIVEVQDWLGHRNIANTMIYAQYTNPRRQRMSEEVRDWAA